MYWFYSIMPNHNQINPGFYLINPNILLFDNNILHSIYIYIELIVYIIIQALVDKEVYKRRKERELI